MVTKISIYMTRSQRDDFNRMKFELSRCLKIKMSMTDVILFFVNIMKGVGLKVILKAVDYPYYNINKN